jgi:PAS domain S-box-containing protein
MAVDDSRTPPVEELLRQTQDNLRALLELLPDAVVVSRDRQIVFVNPAGLRMMGYRSVDELRGRSVLELLAPEERASAAANLAAGVPPGQVASVERVCLRPDGSRFIAELSVLHVILEGKPAILAVARDVSERKLYQSRLMLADRMVSVGTLAAGVAHEINNPLTYVSADLALLAEELEHAPAGTPEEPLERWRWLVDEARAGAERIRRIVRDLGTFSRSDDERLAPVDVRLVIDASLSLAANEIRHRAALVKEYGDVPPVMADEARLGQVFLNLLVNAVHAIPSGRASEHRIRVAVRAEGRRVIAEVSDTGVGIARDVLKRIFDPFFTTKPVGAGTGLGLAICHRIVTALGGDITAASEPGRGATFTVSLPACTDEQRLGLEPDVKRAAPMPEERRGRVLVIDDEPSVVRVIARALGGHDVSSTATAREALERLARGERFDVILCDVMMPDVNGADFYRELVRTLPDQAARVVFISGGVFTPELRAFLDSLPNERLDKPFAVDKLRALVRDRIA